jgi:hypothetical protein|tara:strand:- start:816 stop:1028 length:213 start_codon:yes stop_codon:yes gene_type:complete
MMIKEIIKSRKPKDILVEILTFVLVVLITTFIIRFTWNNSLVKHITVLKPLKTFTDALLLSITINVFRSL